MVPTINSRTIRYTLKLSIHQCVKNIRRSILLWIPTVWQLVRFGLVGAFNTGIDLLAYNLLLWLAPTQSTGTLLFYNSIAYALGALNSFVWNKYWTFQLKQPTTPRELLRFMLTTLLGIACNDLILGLASVLFGSLMNHSLFWSNAFKILAIFGTMSISFLGMRLWVFVHPAKKINPDREHPSLVP